jgi:hypothetical protein
MLDRIISKRGHPGENEILPGFSPDQAITATRLVNPDSATLTVIFPPWQSAVKLAEANAKSHELEEKIKQNLERIEL